MLVSIMMWGFVQSSFDLLWVLVLYMFMFMVQGLGGVISGNSMVLGEFYFDLMGLILVWLSCWVVFLLLMMKPSCFGESFYLSKAVDLVLLIMLMVCFLSKGVIMMYMSFEGVLIPLFVLIMVEGSGAERLVSSYYLMMFTFFGSFIMLVVMLMGWVKGESGFMYKGVDLLGTSSSGVWDVMLLMFLVKLPVYGLHMWLPYAHVEASTKGSMILAGLILKLGGFGMLRLFPFLMVGLEVRGILGGLGVYGAMLISMVCLRQMDVKSMIAYSSVAHMGLMMGAMVSVSMMGVMGGFGGMIAHGLSASGLFYLVGGMYERVGTRNMMVMKGVVSLLGGVFWLWVIFVFMNMGVPPFMGFFMEFIMLFALVSMSFIYMVLIFSLVFLVGAYNLCLYMWLTHGKMVDLWFNGMEFKGMVVMIMLLFPSLGYIFNVRIFIEGLL
uniref:NADH-ubiquinone oxidoreductase chain 4 n=1 Tax=Blattisocius tarsalis TaxID=1609195 RepID=A0A6B9WH92_9ACAR|nr:NADH dehydrogenase subunit 4 [Blattisocius tarsalis]QHQ98571.1 NADH dehydrogenase subunit 4 [Blattisocius tarsalis]